MQIFASGLCRGWHLTIALSTDLVFFVRVLGVGERREEEQEVSVVDLFLLLFMEVGPTSLA
jgi:hypothetical protein